MELDNRQITEEELNQLMALIEKIDPEDKVFSDTRKHIEKEKYQQEKDALLSLKREVSKKININK